LRGVYKREADGKCGSQCRAADPSLVANFIGCPIVKTASLNVPRASSFAFPPEPACQLLHTRTRQHGNRSEHWLQDLLKVWPPGEEKAQ
jgi:hypothetical protein